MIDGPYKACFTSSDDAIYGVEGPGSEIGYYAWYLCPENTFGSFEEAAKAARWMNMAFAEGKKCRSREIKALLDVGT